MKEQEGLLQFKIQGLNSKVYRIWLTVLFSTYCFQSLSVNQHQLCLT